MGEFQPCSDTSDLRELSLPQQLYLKPEAKLSITVALPNVRLPGKTISNWEVMERIRQAAEPEQFIMIKVSKSTMEFIRFEGEIENRSQIPGVVTRLDGKLIRLSGFPEPLKVRIAEAKPEFPTRHDWDKYFRDAKNMNEMKPGERPDTVYIQGLPSKWFVSRRDRRNGSLLPSNFALQKVFEIFGEIRHVDIPMLDPYRNDMKASISGIRTFSHVTDATFDAYIQYREYISFVKAMDNLRGMKLVHRDAVKAFSAGIKVDFDKSKHLSDMSIHRRRIERDKLIAKEQEKEEEKRREEEAVKTAMATEEEQKEQEKKQKGERRKEREEKRKQRILKKLKKKEAEQMNIKIAIEERKLLMAQRKLESIRLLDELFERIKVDAQKEVTKQKEKELESQLSKVKKKKEAKLRKKEEKENKKREKLLLKEKKLRKKLMKKIKSQQEQQMEERRERLRKTLEGKVLPKGAKGKTDGDTLEGMEDFDDGAPPMGYPMHFPPYRGFPYRGWVSRGGFMPRGFFPPRRPYRPYRGFGPYPPPWNPRVRSEWQHDDRDEGHEDDQPEGKENTDSDAESSATSKYSNLNSSDEEKKKKGEGSKLWPGYQGMMMPAPPWGQFPDYYHPRFMRRGRGTRPWTPYRGSSRGFHSQEPNPNVPTNSFYMKSINEHYYRYFNRLSKGDGRQSRSRSRSRSASSDRVVCRKVLSRDRSYSRSRSRSRSKSRHRSRSRSKSRHRSRSRSKSRHRSGSRSKSRHRSRSRSKSRNRSRSRSKSCKRSRTRSKSRHRSRSRSKSRNRSRSRSKSRKRSRTRSRSRKRSRSRSKSRSRSRTRSKSRRHSRSRSKSRSHSRSRSKSSHSNRSKSNANHQAKSDRRSKSHSKSHPSGSQAKSREGSESKGDKLSPNGQIRSKSKENCVASISDDRLENTCENQVENKIELSGQLYDDLSVQSGRIAKNFNEKSHEEQPEIHRTPLEETEPTAPALITTLPPREGSQLSPLEQPQLTFLEGTQTTPLKETKVTKMGQVDFQNSNDPFQLEQPVTSSTEVKEKHKGNSVVEKKVTKIIKASEIKREIIVREDIHIDLISDDELEDSESVHLNSEKQRFHDKKDLVGSDLSLSLSGSIDGWSSPERKAIPLNTAGWGSSERSNRFRGRSPTRNNPYNRENRGRSSYRQRGRYDSNRHESQPQVRSLVMRPKTPPRAHSPPVRSRVERPDRGGGMHGEVGQPNRDRDSRVRSYDERRDPDSSSHSRDRRNERGDGHSRDGWHEHGAPGHNRAGQNQRSSDDRRQRSPGNSYKRKRY